jgi:protoheme IX farnesyltransferase
MSSNILPQESILTVSQTKHKVSSFLALVKLRLSLLVVFSGAFGYALATQGAINWLDFLIFCFGSLLITGAANTINQIIEKDIDKLMPRTQNRPLPTDALTVREALIFAITLTLVGTVLLLFVNIIAAGLSVFSLLLYAFAYTPLKTKSNVAVFVGAFPGALPPLIGWVAVQGTVGIEILAIFMIQFVWQFPHFWAIAWVSDEDYRKAGIRLLPSGERDFSSTIQILTYTLLLLPVGLMPWWLLGFTNAISASVITISGLLFSIQALYLLIKANRRAALLLMFGSFIYLPVVQIALLVGKI